MTIKEKIDSIIQSKYSKDIKECNTGEIYSALLDFSKEENKKLERNSGKKKMYYISMEFLIGRLLTNNLISTGLYKDVDNYLKENGFSLAEIEDCEPEPSLGNGGLGRLAACYLDSAATLGLPADGIGLCYHFGLFRQKFENNKQTALKNPWIESNSWLENTDVSFDINFAGKHVKANMYDICVPGYESGAGMLHLFDLETIDESLVADGIDFDKAAIDKNLTLFLYPDDSDDAGRILRVYQEYFLASCSAQLIINEARERGSNLHDLNEYAIVQINDTHPSMVIPELIRLLSEGGLSTDEAVSIVEKMCAYTNHTILAEALEKWPLAYINTVAPQIVPIIQELDRRAKAKYDDEAVAIIDEDQLVHMANMDIHYGFSVNGVAALHTEILERSELNHFYKIYPEKFNNKTNGVTFRRWLMACNPELTELIEELIGSGFKKDASELEKLLEFKNNADVKNKLLKIKNDDKKILAGYLKENTGVDVDTNSIFDIQIKRMHEYKRQQMNALWIIRQYLRIKEGYRPKRPVTCIFGAKAAPAYIIAQDIIHLILCLGELINNDPEVSKYLKVVMVENYNVSAAEKLIPACDISEQISLASKEASGTGNMKFMLNGAVTLGTMDGANVEIAELVNTEGNDNIYIFGKSSEEVIKLYNTSGYSALSYYQNDEIGKLVDFIVSREMIKIGNRENLARLHNELISKDWFMTLLDAESYFEAKEKILEDYEDRDSWAEKMIVNIAKAGFFSSDRSINDYNKDIWKL